ncbi:hypothetical protein Zmor_021354 [Zophobas morio]|uniref:CHK kinase-like domain-containing protein n=1 Tax=Zophobas morio TaxID=2755281 RepID=A0AA38I559_9CUCU|nr:hypothetical protein Zmor_021354 [Zophobas morio]
MELLKERPDIISFLENVAKEQGMRNYKLTNIQTNKEKEGNMGLIIMATIEETTTNKKLNLVVKAAFLDEDVRQNVPIERAFLNEIYFYTEVYPTFKKFERECGILHGINFVPKCYKTLTDNGKEMLCLDNLKASNFEIFDKNLNLDHEHVSLIFKTYGKFHAYSFAMQDQRPEEYAKLVGKFYNIYCEFLDNPNENIKNYLKGSGKVIEECLIPGEDDEAIEKYKKYVDYGIVQQMIEVVTADCDHSVVLHGDCWSNNMIFKYETENDVKKPIDMRFLDLQVVKVGSPACDLSYALYSGAFKDVYDNLDDYLKIYYESFSSLLKGLGSDPEKLFPFEALKNHWKKYARFGMIMAYGILTVKSPGKKVVQITGDDESSNKLVGEENKNFRRRLRELVKHMAKIDAL